MGVVDRQERRSFTLSRESVEYLELEKQQRKAPSTSSVLDEILRERRREREEVRLQSTMIAYYDSIGEDERAGNRAWGAFSESQMKPE